MFGFGLAKKLSGVGLAKKMMGRSTSLAGGIGKTMMPGKMLSGGKQIGRALSPSFAPGMGRSMMQNPMQNQGQMPMMQGQGIAPTPNFMGPMGPMGEGNEMINPYDPRMRKNNQGGFVSPY